VDRIGAADKAHKNKVTPIHAHACARTFGEIGFPLPPRLHEYRVGIHTDERDTESL
jgi:hypothetical protein